MTPKMTKIRKFVVGAGTVAVALGSAGALAVAPPSRGSSAAALPTKEVAVTPIVAQVASFNPFAVTRTVPLLPPAPPSSKTVAALITRGTVAPIIRQILKIVVVP